MKITVERGVQAPVDRVWSAWTSPADIMAWNAASDDWHTPRATDDLRQGGAFCFRMEARDGSAGFDFEGTYTRIVPGQRIEAQFGGRGLLVEFIAAASSTLIRETFDAEAIHPVEMQRVGWQAILDRFAHHVESKAV